MLNTKMASLALCLLSLPATSAVNADSARTTLTAHSAGKSALNIRDGQTLSGAAQIKVKIPNRAIEYGSVRLAVDHTNAGIGFEAASSPSGITATTIPMDTFGFSNGWHLLTIDILGQRPEDYRVKFDNPISNISIDGLIDPKSKGHKDDPPKIAHIMAILSHPQPWTVTIASSANHPAIVRAYHGTGKNISVRWDGRDNSGKMTPDDNYTVLIRSGKVQSEPGIINKLSLH